MKGGFEGKSGGLPRDFRKENRILHLPFLKSKCPLRAFLISNYSDSFCAGSRKTGILARVSEVFPVCLKFWALTKFQ